MAYFFTFHPSHRHPQFFSPSPCKYSSARLFYNSHLHSQASLVPCPLHESSLGKVLHETPKQTTKFSRGSKIRPGFSSSSLGNSRVQGNLAKTSGSATVNTSEGKTWRRLNDANRRKKDSGFSSNRAKDSDLARNSEGNGKSVKVGQYNQVVKGKKWKRPNKSKTDPGDVRFKVQLDMCSKSGDVMGAIALYDSAIKEGIRLTQYHYTIILYLCSSAALGVVQPAKSGSGSRSTEVLVQSTGTVDGYEEIDEDEEEEEEDDANNDLDIKEQIVKKKRAEILVSEPVKKYALERGYEVYERMCLENIPMNEAALTSVARMAMAMGDGDKAFDMVKQMKELGINPKLRSYGPALSVFCSKGEVEKAFEVEKHMLDHGVQPEEPELEALLRVCIDGGKSDKIYYLMHKLRTTVRHVSPSIADLIQRWFESIEASRVGKRKWDLKMIVERMESVGGGWHGQGWLGSGKWSVSRTNVEADGSCKCCGEKLALIDLDPKETEKFAESVAAIASKKEKNLSFQKFQRWLDYYGPFEAIVDAANVGLYSQKKFKLSKVKAVVNGIRQMLTSKKWPLVILHNRRVTGPNTDEPVNKGIIDRWKDADALYSTPTGSNDDWYWLYAAIKYKCLLVTNDEMRDHIFQLLGNDFFPRWKERHQVRFTFSEVGPVFHMPPPCSVVIQESKRGQWHIPIVSEHQSEGERTWLCIKRIKSSVSASKQDPHASIIASPKPNQQNDENQPDNLNSKMEGEEEDEQIPAAKQAQETYRRTINLIPKSVVPSFRTVLEELQFVEEQSGYVIDFQI